MATKNDTKTARKGTTLEELRRKLSKHERGTPEDASALVEAVQEMRCEERRRLRGKPRRATGS